MDLIADVLQNDRSGFSSHWARANTLRKNGLLAEVEAYLRVMRECADSEVALVERVRRGLMRHFEDFDGEP